MDALVKRWKKCSIAIIPPWDWQRQGKCLDLCGYRDVCAIFIQVVDYRLFGRGAVELDAETVGVVEPDIVLVASRVDSDTAVGNACGFKVSVDLLEVWE